MASLLRKIQVLINSQIRRPRRTPPPQEPTPLPEVTDATGQRRPKPQVTEAPVPPAHIADTSPLEDKAPETEPVEDLEETRVADLLEKRDA